MTNFSDIEKEQVAEENMPLVHYVVNMFLNSGIAYDELASIAMVGYAKALNKYDTEREVKFSTYAINCIKNEILFFLRKEKKHMKNNISMNMELSVDKNGNSLQLEDIISKEDLDVKSLEDMIIDEDNKQILLKALKHLLPREQYIITYRYGLDRGIVKTQKQIAETILMSQANVSKIEKISLKKIKKLLKDEIKEN